MEVTLADIMGSAIADSHLPSGMGILHNAEGVDLLPANIELSGMEVTLVNTNGGYAHELHAGYY